VEEVDFDESGGWLAPVKRMGGSRVRRERERLGGRLDIGRTPSGNVIWEARKEAENAGSTLQKELSKGSRQYVNARFAAKRVAAKADRKMAEVEERLRGAEMVFKASRGKERAEASRAIAGLKAEFAKQRAVNREVTVGRSTPWVPAGDQPVRVLVRGRFRGAKDFIQKVFDPEVVRQLKALRTRLRDVRSEAKREKKLPDQAIVKELENSIAELDKVRSGMVRSDGRKRRALNGRNGEATNADDVECPVCFREGVPMRCFFKCRHLLCHDCHSHLRRFICPECRAGAMRDGLTTGLFLAAFLAGSRSSDRDRLLGGPGGIGHTNAEALALANGHSLIGFRDVRLEVWGSAVTICGVLRALDEDWREYESRVDVDVSQDELRELITLFAITGDDYMAVTVKRHIPRVQRMIALARGPLDGLADTWMADGGDSNGQLNGVNGEATNSDDVDRQPPRGRARGRDIAAAARRVLDEAVGDQRDAARGAEDARLEREREAARLAAEAERVRVAEELRQARAAHVADTVEAVRRRVAAMRPYYTEATDFTKRVETRVTNKLQYTYSSCVQAWRFWWWPILVVGLGLALRKQGAGFSMLGFLGGVKVAIAVLTWLFPKGFAIKEVVRHSWEVGLVRPGDVPLRDHRRQAWLGDAWIADTRIVLHWKRERRYLFRYGPLVYEFAVESVDRSQLEFSGEVLRQAFLPGVKYDFADLVRIGSEARRVTVVNGPGVVLDDPAKTAMLVSLALCHSDAEALGVPTTAVGLAGDMVSGF